MSADTPEAMTEAEAILDDREQRAYSHIYGADLDKLLDRREDKLAALSEIRGNIAELARALRQHELDQDSAELDAIVEMEAQPDYNRMPNEAGRRTQLKIFLRDFMPYQQVHQRWRRIYDKRASAQLQEQRLEAELQQLRLAIDVKRTQLDVIASFVRGT